MSAMEPQTDMQPDSPPETAIDLDDLGDWRKTHSCNSLGRGHVGETVVLMGWVQRRRDHGGLIFVDLRDREGLTQVVFDPQFDAVAHEHAHSLRGEYVIAVTGTVRPRPEGMTNPKLVTGEIEVITRELKIQPGDILLGRPLGMSCGCPVTHCGVVMESDMKSGVITWCVTGPLSARRNSCKDLGYYSALAYDGIVLRSKSELKIGCRYWFMPKKCMLQWRHSGLVNFLKQTPQGLQVHVEGLMIG